MQTLACHQIRAAGEIAGVQQLGNHQLMQIAVLAGVQQVAEGQVGAGCITAVDCDPYWDNVILASHLDGANNATSAVDEKGVTVTFNGGAKLSTAQVKFGTASLTSPDYNGSVEFDTDVIAALDGVNGKITFWLYGVSNGTYQYIFSTENVGGAVYSISAALLASNVVEVYIGSPDENSKVDITGTIDVVGDWHYVQITKVGADWTMHIGGTLDGSVSASSSAVHGGSTSIALASRYNIPDRLFPSYIDDFKITLGTFTSDFTPPTAPFADVAC